MRLCWLAVLTGCTSMSPVRPPPATLVLDGPTTVAAGQNAGWSVTGPTLAVGDVVTLGWSRRQGAGPCLAGGQVCLDLRNPSPITTALAELQPSGDIAAVFELTVPTTSVPSVSLQAARLDGPAKTNALQISFGNGPQEVRNYIFGHSLLLHSADANVPMWLHALAEEAGHTYAMSGQYGFADTHASNLPPISQWGVPGVTGPWDEDFGDTFADIDFTTVLFTEANFRQYYPPTQPDPDGFLAESSVQSTATVFDWVDSAEPGIDYILYENWPDMAGFTSANFTTTFPNATELAAYHTETAGPFHDWWVDYQDGLRAARPGLDVKLVPVGSILAQLLTTTLSDVPPEALYEDDAPHGQPTLYFLAGLVTYMGMYGEPAPASFVVPGHIAPQVQARYPQLVNEIWSALDGFRHPDGSSRVW